MAGKRCLILTAVTDLPTQAADEANPNTDTGAPVTGKGRWAREEVAPEETIRNSDNQKEEH